MSRPPGKNRRPRQRTGGKNQVRIIGGNWRGRKLSFPDIAGLRPTGDRVRETLFNWLSPYLPGANCLDLFAGCGALGFEALSRGAKAVTFVERDMLAARAIADNCTLLNAENGTLLNADALQWVGQPAQQAFDIVFLDPPFNELLLEPAIIRLTENHYLQPGALVYVETARDVVPNLPPDWQLVREKAAGMVCSRLCRHIVRVQTDGRLCIDHRRGGR